MRGVLSFSGMRLFSLLLFLPLLLQAESSFQFLGNPFVYKYPDGEEIYARNIWDMQLFRGRIYLGAGNSSNRGPAQNAGPVPLLYLEPETGKFIVDYIVKDEQIDLFRLEDGKLYIPGHDATEKWDFGNFYVNDGNRWQKVRTLPKALHVYDLLLHRGQIFTAIGLNKVGAVMSSGDGGKSWTSHSHGSGRVYGLLKVGDQLFAHKLFNPSRPKNLAITQWVEGQGFSARFDLNAYDLFPQTDFNRSGSLKITRSVALDSESYYIGAYKHNDHQSKPIALYRAQMVNSQLRVTRVPIAESSTPRDILVRGRHLYILVSSEEGEGFEIAVYRRTLQGEGAKEEAQRLISFNYPVFARSFEELNHCFYFGMGVDLKSSGSWRESELKDETGDVVKSCM
ncbi:MAG: hypothetical protein HQL48_00755 [Gammaproteobacteria bacterium]|nr:hypothetical protein [Gammaproteobacteria bacterium]